MVITVFLDTMLCFPQNADDSAAPTFSTLSMLSLLYYLQDKASMFVKNAAKNL
jgi:hypothetical protein